MCTIGQAKPCCLELLLGYPRVSLLSPSHLTRVGLQHLEMALFSATGLFPELG